MLKFSNVETLYNIVNNQQLATINQKLDTTQSTTTKEEK